MNRAMIAPGAVFTFKPQPYLQSGFEPEHKQNVGGARRGCTMVGGKLADLLPRPP